MYLKLIDQTSHCLLFLDETFSKYYLVRKSHLDEDGFMNVFIVGKKYFVTIGFKEVNIFLDGLSTFSRPIVKSSGDRIFIENLLENTFGFY
ncbi:hypothetical protein ACT4YK_06230 [Acinetobacter baumannii]|nr:hypothetical protein [Acinetobacter baumannii]